MGLEKYWKKRNFEQTPEPQGRVAPAAAPGAASFVIQKHDASHLHYDFRLEIGGTLKSWAVPKGPSLDPGEKRLAVEVEDHPLAYASFEGSIPEGEYGGGTVLLWDRGRWQPDGDPEAGYRDGKLHFRLEGEKLQGEWSLVRMGRADADGRHNWLLIKSRDEFARRGAEADITGQRPGSVLSGRGLDAIAAGSPVASGNTSAGTSRSRGSAGLVKTPPARRTASSGKARRGSAPEPTPLPDFIEPQLATLVDAPPAQGLWLCEMKYDGYRLLARLDAGQVSLWTRNRQDWTVRLPEVAEALAALPVKSAWLDGEVVAVDSAGHGNFSLLQQALGNAGLRHPETERILYYAFDLLYLNGYDLRDLPEQKRKELLQELFRNPGRNSGQSPLRYSEHLPGHVDELYRQACQQGEEGIMLKLADAPYHGERNRHWLKLKCGYRQEFVIGGYTDPEGKREEFGALLVGYHDPGRGLVYAGRVGTGFDAERLAHLGSRLRRLERKTTPFDVPPQSSEARGVHWVTPQLVADVRFAGWTRIDRLRQAAFLGLREDKPAAEVRREQPVAAPANGIAADAAGEPDDRGYRGRAEADAAAASTAERGDVGRDGAGPAPLPDVAGNPRRSARADADGDADAGERDEAPLRLSGVAISHPSRLVYPEAGISKGEVARYFEAVAPWLLPQLKGRPLTLLRCPQGLGSCFFQKHLTGSLPASLQAVTVQEEKQSATYMTADSLTALLELVQVGVLELHTWGARRDRLDRPDRLIFDLDPAADVAWSDFVEGVFLLRGLLWELELPAFLKTTGGKGVHVEVPLQRVHGWDEVKEFAEAVARHLAQQLPERFVAQAAKRVREGRIFIDYLRNDEGATAIAAYSTRARPGAPVALPLHWEELAEALPGRFTLRNAIAHLQQAKSSPWAGYESSRARLGKRLLQKLDRFGE